MFAAATAILDAAFGLAAGAARPTTAPAPAAPVRGALTTPSLVVRTPPPAQGSVAAPPVPTPPPATRDFVYPYVPPLSPDEALVLIRACIDVLAKSDAPTLAARCQRVGEIIGAVSRYLTVLDQRHSTLASYKWHFIDRESVGSGIERGVFRAQPVIPNVSAISFAADDGDVRLYSVVVYDAAGHATTFTLNRLVEHNYPHEEICYLFFPTTIQSVVTRCEAQQGRSRAPRLTVFAGVAREQEYLKQALWYLRYARRGIQRAAGERTTPSPHLEAARKNLRLAATRLIRFRMKRRY